LLYAPDIVPNVGAECPSIRLKNMRNGIQEYEYLKLLESFEPDKGRVKELVNSIIKEPFKKNQLVISIYGPLILKSGTISAFRSGIR